jgi:NADPH-dependent F420 reductase
MTLMTWELKVGIIGGTGTEGKGLALRFSQAGVAVGIGSRDPQRAENTAAFLNEQLAGAGHRALVQGFSNAAVAGGAEFLILAIPFSHAEQILGGCKAFMRPGCIVVDITVPLVFTPGQKNVSLLKLPEGSGSRHLAGLIPAGADLVAAFKTLPGHLLGDLDETLDCDEFVCGDSAEARRRVVDLLNFIPGLRPIDIGGLECAATLEHMCALAVSINRLYKVKGSRFRVIGL